MEFTGKARSPSAILNRSNSRPCIRACAAINEFFQPHESLLKSLAPERRESEGALIDIEARDIPEDCSFLEMLDIVNEDLLKKGTEPDRLRSRLPGRICGTCSLSINGVPHGPSETTTCQLYMRKFKDGDTIYVEPFRAKPFPVVRDLIVDRSAFERIQQAGVLSRRAPVPRRMQCDSDSEDLRRRGDGSRGVHRVRGLRGGLSECERDAVCRREGFAFRACSRKGGGSARRAP